MTSNVDQLQGDQSMFYSAPLDVGDIGWNASVQAINDNYDTGDYMQYLNDFDDDGNITNDPNADIVEHNTQQTSVVADAESAPAPAGPAPAVAAAEPAFVNTEPLIADDEPAAVNTELVLIDSRPAMINTAPFTDMFEQATNNPAPVSLHNESILIDAADFDMQWNAQQPNSGYATTILDPMIPVPIFPVSPDPAAGLQQPRYTSSLHRTTSAPPGFGCGEYNQFRPSSAPPRHGEYHHFPEQQQQYNYPEPPNGMYDQNGMQWNNAPGPYQPLVTNMGQPSYRYQSSHQQQQRHQQTSASCPGSPSQIVDPSLAMKDQWKALQGMPRHMDRYQQQGPQGMTSHVHQNQQPIPNGNYNPATMFGHQNGYQPGAISPPTSNPRKRATFNASSQPASKATKKVKGQWRAATPTNSFLYDSDSAAPASHPIKLLNQPLTSTVAPPGVDLSKAVELDTRRNKNPGRKNTIAQTAAVVKRNRNRRERYRMGLTQAKRVAYDQNAAVAKGMVVFDAEADAEGVERDVEGEDEAEN